MFSKKPDIDNTYFELPDDDGRTAFRVSPPVSDQVRVLLPDSTLRLRVVDLSAGGLSCQGKLPKDRNIRAFLILPDDEGAMAMSLDVLRVDDVEKVSHCRFIDLKNPDEERIHRYVLDTQKRLLRGQVKP